MEYDRSNIFKLDFQKVFESVQGSYLLLSIDLTILDVSEGYIRYNNASKENIIGRKIFHLFPYNQFKFEDEVIQRLQNSLIKLTLQTKVSEDGKNQKFKMKGSHLESKVTYWAYENWPVYGTNHEVVQIIHRLEDITGSQQLEDLCLEQKVINQKLNSETNKIESGQILINNEVEDSVEIKILLVDDREDNLFALEQVLLNDGYQIIKANSGMEALKILLHEYDFSLILMDVRMPGLNGIETAELIYARERLKQIPIIFITGAEFNESFVFKGYKTGGVDYILKPINPELLRAKVGVFVDLYRKNHLLIAHEQNLKHIADQLELKNKALANANSELEAFTYSVSHDLRAPLRAMDGYSQILQEDYCDILDEEGKKNLNKIVRNAHKMSLLIDDLLALSRVGRKELSKDSIDMNSLVNMVLFELNSQIDASKLVIRLNSLDAGLGDLNLVKQIWVNLISNSIKFTGKNPKGVIEIGSEKLKDEIIYYIRDNGAGFDMNYYDKLFGVFQRLHTEKEFEGTGVGLAIASRIVSRHGGRIWAKGEINKGATFSFSLPR
jgi:signal transduction histidine kinase